MLTETWIQEGAVPAARVAKWATLGKDVAQLRLSSSIVPTNAVEIRKAFPKLRKFQWVTATYPLRAQASVLRSLAGAIDEVVVDATRFPTAEEIETLNLASPSRVLFIFAKFPEKAQALVLAGLKVPYGVSFNCGRYPRYIEKFPIALLPKDVALEITVDYWPRYDQMDTWNLIPQATKRLRIADTALSDGSLPYLRNMRDIAELVFSSEGDVLSQQWEKLEAIPVRWSTTVLPSAKALDRFALSRRFGAPRKLVVDRDGAMTAAERARLDSSGLETEWIHQAP